MIALSSNDDKTMRSIDSIETLHMEQEKILHVRKKKSNVII